MFSLSRFLGHLYAAEALINMDQIFEAIQHLAPDSVCDVAVVLPVLPEQGGFAFYSYVFIYLFYFIDLILSMLPKDLIVHSCFSKKPWKHPLKVCI